MKTKHFKKIDSTNKYLIEKIKSNSIKVFPQCVRADIQTAGIGRHNRLWESKMGGLYFSIADKFNSKKEFTKYPLLFAVLMHKLLNEIYEIIGFKIKWPNDLYYMDKKLAGVLTQTVIQDSTVYTIIGIGLNIENNPTLEKSISLNKIISDGIKPDINFLFEQFLKKYETTDLKRNEIVNYINKYLYAKNRWKIIKVNNNRIEGKILRVNKDFSLKIETKNAKQNINIGEVVD